MKGELFCCLARVISSGMDTVAKQHGRKVNTLLTPVPGNPL